MRIPKFDQCPLNRSKRSQDLLINNSPISPDKGFSVRPEQSKPPLRAHGITMKQSLFDAIFSYFVRL
jgi:hypothetical protein